MIKVRDTIIQNEANYCSIGVRTIYNAIKSYFAGSGMVYSIFDKFLMKTCNIYCFLSVLGTLRNELYIYKDIV